MRHRRRIVGLVCLVFGLQYGIACAGESIELAQAINYALGQNRTLIRSALNIESQRYAIDAEQAEFGFSVRPQASVTGLQDDNGYSYGLSVSKKMITGTELRISAADENMPLNVSGIGLQQQRLQVAISQPLFRNYGTLVNGEGLVQSNNDLKTAQRQYELQKNDLVIRVVETYESLLRLQRQVESETDSLERMEKLHRVTKAHEILGKTTRVDTLRVALLRGEAASRLEIAKERLASTQKDFVELLGFTLEVEFRLAPVSVLDFEVPDMEEAVRIALANRVDYAQALQDREDALRNVRIARRSLLPDVRLTVGHEWRRESLDYAQVPGLDDNIWFFRVSMGTDLNPAIERANLGKSALGAMSSNELIEIIEISIARLVQQHLLAYRRARNELDIAYRNYELAASRAKLTRRLFSLGRENNFSVTDAETSFMLSENRLFLAQSESVNSGYRLMRALGTLVETPANLKPPGAYSRP